MAAASVITAGVGIGAAGGMATHFIAEDFERASTTFQGICEDMEKLSKELESHNQHTIKLRSLSTSTTDDATNLSASIDRMEYGHFCKVFDILLEGIKEAHDTVCIAQTETD